MQHQPSYQKSHTLAQSHQPRDINYSKKIVANCEEGKLMIVKSMRLGLSLRNRIGQYRTISENLRSSDKWRSRTPLRSFELKLTKTPLNTKRQRLNEQLELQQIITCKELLKKGQNIRSDDAFMLVNKIEKRLFKDLKEKYMRESTRRSITENTQKMHNNQSINFRDIMMVKKLQKGSKQQGRKKILSKKYSIQLNGQSHFEQEKNIANYTHYNQRQNKMTNRLQIDFDSETRTMKPMNISNLVKSRQPWKYLRQQNHQNRLLTCKDLTGWQHYNMTDRQL